MKIENSTIPLAFLNIGALAVTIIGAVAFKQLGAFHDFAPLKGVIMMGSAGAFFCIECVIYSRKKSEIVFDATWIFEQLRKESDADKLVGDPTDNVDEAPESYEPTLEDIAKLQEKRKLLTEYGIVEILPPTKDGDSWSIQLPNFDEPFQFQGSYRDARPNDNEFMTSTHINGDFLELIIHYRHKNEWSDFTIYNASRSKRPDMVDLKPHKYTLETIIENEMVHVTQS